MRECILTVQAIGITLFDLNLTAIAFKFNTGGGIFFWKKNPSNIECARDQIQIQRDVQKRKKNYARCRMKNNKYP